MGAFTLDTSGAVEMRRDLLGNGVPAEPDRVEWSDLSPFEQGYVEAVLNAPCALTTATGFLRHFTDRAHTAPAFSDLAPETLAAIRKDCAGGLALVIFSDKPPTAYGGRDFWHARQRGGFPGMFPPLAPSLGDDGKVYLRRVA